MGQCFGCLEEESQVHTHQFLETENINPICINLHMIMDPRFEALMGNICAVGTKSGGEVNAK